MLNNASLEVFPPHLLRSPVLATLLSDNTTSGPHYPFAPQAAVRSTKGKADDTHAAQARERLEGGEVDCPIDPCLDDEGSDVFFAVDLECVLLKYRRWHECFPRIKPFYGKSLEDVVHCRTPGGHSICDNQSIYLLIHMRCAVVPRCSPMMVLEEGAYELREFYEGQSVGQKHAFTK